ncbi:hypothetical protein LTR28_011872 [Elasticomyces elasticus]|nr:hypothetical protein LTR28_011872 [Elasticomyces elasticus]
MGPLGHILVRGEDGNEIVPELRPVAGEPVIDKPCQSAFAYTDLELLLRLKGICNLVIAGVTTDVSVLSTMRDASDRGFDCLLIRDGTAAAQSLLQTASVETVKSEGGAFGATAKLQDVVNVLQNVPPIATQIPDTVGSGGVSAVGVSKDATADQPDNNNETHPVSTQQLSGKEENEIAEIGSSTIKPDTTTSSAKGTDQISNDSVSQSVDRPIDSSVASFPAGNVTLDINTEGDGIFLTHQLPQADSEIEPVDQRTQDSQTNVTGKIKLQQITVDNAAESQIASIAEDIVAEAQSDQTVQPTSDAVASLSETMNSDAIIPQRVFGSVEEASQIRSGRVDLKTLGTTTIDDVTLQRTLDTGATNDLRKADAALMQSSEQLQTYPQLSDNHASAAQESFAKAVTEQQGQLEKTSSDANELSEAGTQRRDESDASRIKPSPVVGADSVSGHSAKRPYEIAESDTKQLVSGEVSSSQPPAGLGTSDPTTSEIKPLQQDESKADNVLNQSSTTDVSNMSTIAAVRTIEVTQPAADAESDETSVAAKEAGTDSKVPVTSPNVVADQVPHHRALTPAEQQPSNVAAESRADGDEDSSNPTFSGSANVASQSTEQQPTAEPSTTDLKESTVGPLDPSIRGPAVLPLDTRRYEFNSTGGSSDEAGVAEEVGAIKNAATKVAESLLGLSKDNRHPLLSDGHAVAAQDSWARAMAASNAQSTQSQDQSDPTSSAGAVTQPALTPPNYQL